MTEQSAVELTQEECLICERVKIENFYRELREVGFTRGFALKILKVLAQVYFKDPTFFAGKARGTIKGGITYAVYSHAYSLLDNLEVMKLRSNLGIGSYEAMMVLSFRHGILDEENVGKAIAAYNESVANNARIASLNQMLLGWKFGISEVGLRNMYHAIEEYHQDILAAVCGRRN